MSSLNSTIDTVNAAATAIVFAESRPQQSSSPKRRWGSWWSLYWCFGSPHKNSKRIRHAILVPEPVAPRVAAPAAENLIQSTAITLPFIAPPSSPASFLQSDPSSAIQSPAGILSLTSLSVQAYSPQGPANIFAIGPYAHETQLVSPPVFSTFNTEPSTAPFTPPPESVQLTTPPSPEVPFAQLLTSSLERTRRNSGTTSKFSLSHYEFQSYQLYPGSPGGNLISPGSVISNSGTSSPFPDGHPMIELRKGEAPKILCYEHFSAYKWGSQVGSGSLTPDGVGLGSRIGSGCLTPDCVGYGSRLGSGSLTPARLEHASRDGFLMGNQISDMTSHANLKDGCKKEEVVDHRVSFELTGEDVARCLASKSLSLHRQSPDYVLSEEPIKRDAISMANGNCCDANFEETSNKNPDQSHPKHRSTTLGSIKEFNFDNTKEDILERPTIGSEWWANEKIVGSKVRSSNNWTYFPVLQPGVS